MYIKKLILAITILGLGTHIFGDNKTLSTADFLRIAQHPKGQKSWAQLSGTATHERKKMQKKESPIYLGIKFAPQLTVAELSIGDEETYSIGQSSFSANEKVTIIPAKDTPYSSSILKDYGIKPDDLTMSFLFWDLLKELEPDTAAGQKCRVFLLRSPDKQEIAKAYISSRYFFPLKVEWKRVNEDESYRALKVNSFKNINDLWLVNEILFSGPGWRTTIDFNDCKAGLIKKGAPKDLFRLKKIH